MIQTTSLRSIAVQVRDRQRQLGTRQTLTLLARRAGRVFYESEPMLVIVKDLGEIAVPVRRGRVRLEPLERRHEAELRAFNAERADRGSDARMESDFRDGYHGFVGYLGDELIGCYWWTEATLPQHRDMRLFALGIELGPRDAYGYDFFVLERHRAGGTALDMLYQVETALRDRGFERAWGYVLTENRGARFVYDARGYEARWAIDRRRIAHRWRNRIVPIEGEGKRG